MVVFRVGLALAARAGEHCVRAAVAPRPRAPLPFAGDARTFRRREKDDARALRRRRLERSNSG